MEEVSNVSIKMVGGGYACFSVVRQSAKLPIAPSVVRRGTHSLPMTVVPKKRKLTVQSRRNHPQLWSEVRFSSFVILFLSHHAGFCRDMQVGESLWSEGGGMLLRDKEALPIKPS